MDAHQFRIAHERWGCQYVFLTVEHSGTVEQRTTTMTARLLSYEHPYGRFQRPNGDTFYVPIAQIHGMSSAEVPA